MHQKTSLFHLLIVAGTFSLALPLFAQSAKPAPAHKKIELKAPHELMTLNNGLRVILQRDTTIPRVTVNVWYHVGSGQETKGRTGFAHLFEHIMFEGSKNVPEGKFDKWLEGAGGTNNGSTTEDRTNYYESVPSGALELALFLESDRMGTLLEVMTEKRVDGQRDVVKNERRQSYENAPYGKVWLEIPAMLYPAGHPYSWTVIGSMKDLSAASVTDVKGFFKKYYGPNNASIAIVGDIDIEKTKKLVKQYFAKIPRGPEVKALAKTPIVLKENVSKVIEDDVQLEMLMMMWPTIELYHPDDASLDVAATILGSGKNARLYKRLVYELQIAQSVSVWHSSQALSGNFTVQVLLQPGVNADKVRAIVDDEIKKFLKGGPTEKELTRVRNQLETRFLGSFEGFESRADSMNGYLFYDKPADWFQADLQRTLDLSALQVTETAKRYLEKPRAEIRVVPRPTKASAQKEGGAQ